MKMKKTGKSIAIILVIFLTAFVLSCGGGGGSASNSGTTKVTVSTSQSKLASSADKLWSKSTSAIPSNVASVRIVISAPDMSTITNVVNVTPGITEIVETFDVPTGINRNFFAIAMDANGASLFQGDITADLDGTSKYITILMSSDISGEWTLSPVDQDGSKAPISFITFTQTGNSLTFSATISDGGSFNGSGTIIGYNLQSSATGTECGNTLNTSITGTVSADGSTISGIFTKTGGCSTAASTGTFSAVRGHVVPAILLTSVSVTPANPSIAVGATQQFAATGTYSDGTTHDITMQVTWNSSNSAVATVNNTGLATGVAAGTATISATSGSISGNTNLTVTATPATFSVGTSPWGIAIDASGNVWVTNTGSNSVTKLSPGGAVLGTFTVGTSTFDIAIDASGNVWVTSGGSNSVTKLSPNGAVLGTFTAGNFPGDIAIDASGNVLVTNNVGSSNNVTKLSPGGAVLGTFTVGNSISDIAIDASGNVWVNSYLINSVTVLRGATTGPQFWPYSGPVWP